MRAMQTLVLAAIGLFLIGAEAMGQGTPNFSGTWVLSPESVPKGGGTRTGTGSTVGIGGRSGSADFDRNLVSAFTCGTECTITQTSKTLTIKRPADAQGVAPPVVILNLDGSNSKHQQAGRNGGPPTDYFARANWSGNTLVVTREHGQGQVVTTQTLLLQDGRLTIAHSINLPVTLPTLVYTKK